MRLMTEHAHNPENFGTIVKPLLGLVVLLVLLAISIKIFGIAGLMVPVLALVPTVYVILIWISLGKS